MHIVLLFALLPYVLAARLIKADQQATAIPGKWIVKLKDDLTATAMAELTATMSIKPEYEYTMDGFRGFAGELSDEELALLQALDQVESIQQDTKVHAFERVVQKNATWGLARISSSQPAGTEYSYDDSAGEGTCAYIIDTGIYVDHPDFGGRAEWLGDFTEEDLEADGYGHGTHVAGIVGSTTYGVAKKTKLYAAKVLDSSGDGRTAIVLAGISAVVEDARTRDCPKGVVANMSLGGGRVNILNQAVAAAVRSGVFISAAAGNKGSNVKYVSPGSEPSICTVGATSRNDTFPSWSNYGSLVDLLAPGANITSTWNDGSVKTISGTSMAAPHVAGIAAYLLGLGYSGGEGLCGKIAELALGGVVRGVPKGTNNLLAHNWV